MTFPLAVALGFSVACIPGPMIVLITTETLTKGARAGITTMAAPLLLDALVMLPLGLALQDFFTGGGAVRTVGLIGGCLLGWLGFTSIRAARGATASGPAVGRSEFSRKPEFSSFLRGVATHLSSPYPYLYWATVGTWFIRQGFARDGISGALLFPLGFWLGTSAFTLLLIFVAAQGKRLVAPRFEPWLYSGSGLLLILSGITLAVRTWSEPMR